jgi:predicted esterase
MCFGPRMKLHQGQRVLHGGTPLHTARAVVILIHGRGASADDILGLGERVSEDVGCVSLFAPQALDHVWYPQRFFAPLESNEPYLTSALNVITDIIAHVAAAGLPSERVIISGFSQGACLSLEYALRNPRRYGGIVGLSGAVIGPPGRDREAVTGLNTTPVYLGCCDKDPHIPLASVEESARLLAAAGATVTKTIFPGMGHTVNDDEVREFRALLSAVAATP